MTSHLLPLIGLTMWFIFTAMWPLANAYAEPNRRFRPSRRLAWGLFASMMLFVSGLWVAILPMPGAQNVGRVMGYIAVFNGVPLWLIYGWLSVKHARARKKGVGKLRV
jgi:hypothetical protein